MLFICECCGGDFEKELNLKQKLDKYKPKFCSKSCNKTGIKLKKKTSTNKKKTKSSKEEVEFGNVIQKFFPSLRRQFRIKGYYHAYDFCVPDKQLIIEFDGKYWHSPPKVQMKDRKHDAVAITNGFQMVRISDEIWKKFFSGGFLTRDNLNKLIKENTIK